MPAVEFWDRELEIYRHVSNRNPLPMAAHYGPSGLDPVTDTLVSDTRSDAFEPLPGRTFYMVLTGAGSGPVTAVFSSDEGATFMPEAVGVGGGAPLVMNQFDYAGEPFRHPMQVDQAGVQVAALPGTITGDVTVTFVQ